MKRTIEQLIDAVQLETVDDHGTARRALVRRIAALERDAKKWRAHARNDANMRRAMDSIESQHKREQKWLAQWNIPHK